MSELYIPPLDPPEPGAPIVTAPEGPWYATLPHFRGTAKKWSTSSLFVLSLALFAAVTFARQGKIENTLIFLGVLLFHELGHLVAMWMFGYRDLRVFFIPFFGAAASGDKTQVSPGKEATMLLMGPLPGLALSVVTGGVSIYTGEPLWAHLTGMLVAINAFNLLPVLPLDGGRIFSMIFYSRWRWVEILFGVLSAVALCAIGLWLEAYLLAALGLLMFLQQPLRAKLLKLGGQLRTEHPDLPPDPKAVDDAMTEKLYTGVRDLLPLQNRDKEKAIAAWMRELLDIATRRSPSVLGSIGLFVLWVLGFVLGLVGLGLVINSGMKAF